MMGTAGTNLRIPPPVPPTRLTAPHQGSVTLPQTHPHTDHNQGLLQTRLPTALPVQVEQGLHQLLPTAPQGQELGLPLATLPQTHLPMGHNQGLLQTHLDTALQEHKEQDPPLHLLTVLQRQELGLLLLVPIIPQTHPHMDQRQGQLSLTVLQGRGEEQVCGPAVPPRLPLAPHLQAQSRLQRQTAPLTTTARHISEKRILVLLRKCENTNTMLVLLKRKVNPFEVCKIKKTKTQSPPFVKTGYIF